VSNQFICPVEKFALQINYSMKFHQKTNNKKYIKLKIGQISLMIEIAAASVAGFVALNAISSQSGSKIRKIATIISSSY